MSPTRNRIAQRFARDNEREVGAVLHDLVSSGMVFVTGSGQRAVYGTTSEALRTRLVKAEDAEALAHVVWLHAFRGDAGTVDELVNLLGLEQGQIESAPETLAEGGRVKRDGERLVVENLVIPLGSESGTETAMLDHFRAVCKVLARKAERLAVHNQAHTVPACATRLTYYLGQIADVTDSETVPTDLQEARAARVARQDRPAHHAASNAFSAGSMTSACPRFAARTRSDGSTPARSASSRVSMLGQGARKRATIASRTALPPRPRANAAMR
jgi:hypothetical protein